MVGLALKTADGGEKAGVALYKGYTIYTLAPLRALVTVESAQNVMLISRFFPSLQFDHTSAIYAKSN